MSGGSVVYHGPREELIPRFTEWGYPCPDFRNPLDHYSKCITANHESWLPITKVRVVLLLKTVVHVLIISWKCILLQWWVKILNAGGDINQRV